MRKVKFTHGAVDERVIDADDWRNVGVEDQGKVSWNKKNNFTVEVSDAAAEWLVEDDPEHMSIVDESSTDSTSDEGEGDSTGKASGTAKKSSGATKKS